MKKERRLKLRVQKVTVASLHAIKGGGTLDCVVTVIVTAETCPSVHVCGSNDPDCKTLTLISEASERQNCS